MRCLALAFLVMTPVLAAAAGQTNQLQSGKPPAGSNVSSNAPMTYCGMYSLYRAARAMGRDISFHDLLKPQYISSRQGSSLDDLVRAATDQGLHAEPLGRMTCAMLRYVTYPVILHVKNDIARAKDYNHWILFAGVEDGKARIYDGDHPVESVEFADLAARWNGVGLLIADAPISMSFLWLVIAAQFVFYAGTSVSAIFLLAWARRRLMSTSRGVSWSSGWRLYVSEMAMLVALALILGSGFRCVNAGGFLSHSSAVAAIQDKHLGGFLPKVKAEDVRKLAHEADVVIVDARQAADFEAGHIANAINIPPNTSDEQLQKILSDVPRSNRILIYCQSNGCPYSEIVARKLIALGYSNILVFRDGWIAWQRYQEKGEL